MRTFFSIPEFNAYLSRQLARVDMGFEAAMTEIGMTLQSGARDRLGFYHPRVGPFPGWEPLAEATQTDREKRGFTADDPLFRSGELQRHITMTPSPWNVAVGVLRETPTADGRTTYGEIAQWMEFGATRLQVAWIPPRPFLGPTLFEMAPAILLAATEAVFERLLGTVVLRPRPLSMVPVAQMSEAVFLQGQAEAGL